MAHKCLKSHSRLMRDTGHFSVVWDCPEHANFPLLGPMAPFRHCGNLDPSTNVQINLQSGFLLPVRTTSLQRSSFILRGRGGGSAPPAGLGQQCQSCVTNTEVRVSACVKGSRQNIVQTLHMSLKQGLFHLASRF